MNHFIENKSQAKKALDDEKRKIGQVNSKSSVYVRGLKKQNKQKKKWMYFYLLYITSKTIVRNVIHIKNAALPEISSARAEKHSWLKLRPKCCWKP